MIKILLSVLLFSSFLFSSVDDHINEMLLDGQQVSLYKDDKIGRAVISIGFAEHSKKNIAIDMSKQEAMKYLTGFLKGEKVSATDVAESKYIGDTAEESYYSTMKTSINSSLNSAYFYKSGNFEGLTYGVVLISERSKFAKNYFNDKKNNNVVESRGYASLSDGMSKARQNALNEALRSAVEQYSGVQMASKTSIENAEKYSGKLSSVSKGYVKKYEVKKEYKDGNNFVIIIVAEVAEGEPDGKKSIYAIKENMGRPSFYILSSDDRLKSMIENILSENKLDIALNKKDAKYIVNSSASKYEYDVPSFKGMMGIQTTIKIAVKDIYANENVINISNDPESSVEISKSKNVRERNSYNYAFEEIEEKFIKKINMQFVNKFNNGNKVKVKLNRFDRLRDVDELKECIESLPLVKSVNVSPVDNHNVSYTVIYLGNPSDLQLAIMKKSREFRLRGLRTRSSNNSEIVFSF